MNQRQTTELAGRIAIVTGGSAGIGRYTALGLAKRGALTLITGRSAERLADCARWIATESPGAVVETETVDFAALSDVRDLADRIAARHPRIDILIDNAGGVTRERTVTGDGFEFTFQVNHLAPFLLTNLLRPAMNRDGGRIVVVASNAARKAWLDFDDLNLARGWSTMRAYGRSKLANILFTYGLAERLAGSGVTANCLHPGFVATRIGSKGGVYDLAWWFLTRFGLSPRQGAETPIRVAAAPELRGVSGQFFDRGRPGHTNPQSHDPAAIDRLWRVSAEMTGLAA